MHMQVRFGRAAGVPHVSQNLPGPYMLAYFDRNRARSHMSIEHIAIPTDINDDVIPARILKLISTANLPECGTFSGSPSIASTTVPSATL
jgi:hypothetical protein